MVEAQHYVSTRSLVDTLEEQALLEQIIEEVKPPLPGAGRFSGGNFLLWTPFRYPPLKNGSRFGSRNEPSIWYGATQIETALAEKAYYQLVFIDGSAADLSFTADWTAFSVGIRAKSAIDLTGAPFDQHEADISSPTSYVKSQQLGSEMRAAGIEAVLFRSARCSQRGSNIALFEPVFAELKPRDLRTWRCQVNRESCECFALNSFESQALAFPRSQYEIGGRLPSPAV